MIVLNKIMNALDKLVIWLVLPILLFLVVWWSIIGIVPDRAIFIFALAGFCIGIILEVLFRKKWFADIYKIDLRILTAIYFFYSICTFGFFMGVPVFNILPGIAAGCFFAKRLINLEVPGEKAALSIRKASYATAAAMAVICLCAAFFALKDPSDTARNLEGMFRLPNHFISFPVLLSLVVIGGAFLILLQYYFTKIIAMWRYKALTNK